MSVVNVLVTYRSRTGNTEAAAEYIGGEFASRGHDVLVRPYDGLDFAEVAAADLVCVGKALCFHDVSPIPARLSMCS